MKKIILVVLFFVAGYLLNAQPLSTLKKIAERLNSFQTYQTYCYYTFSFPFGGDLTIESEITTKKEPKDTLSGFYYYYKTNENFREDFGDFAAYFKGTVYSSHENNIKKTSILENPERFVDQEIEIEGGKGFIPAAYKSHQLYSITPYQIAETIKTAIKDNNKIEQKPDTLIENITCLRFILSSESVVKGSFVPENDSTHVKTILELCFHKNDFHPIYYKAMTNSELIYNYRIAYFTKTKVDFDIQQDYFSEENLIPKNPGNITQSKKTIDSSSLIGQNAPKWNLPVLGEDKMLTNKNLLGKYVLLEFTATWCGHCIEAASMMNRLEERFKNNNNVALISVFSSDKDKKEVVSKFAEKLKIKTTILYSAEKVGNLYNIYSYPNFMIISPKGKVLLNFPGYSNSVEKNIESTLAAFTD